jgi:hypothetical protein
MDITTIAAKSIYLANRHPRLTRAQFAERWRHHGSVGAAVDGRIREVVALRYCLTQSPEELLPFASDEHDGVALLGMRSVLSTPTLSALVHDNEIAYADELRVFERPVQDVTMNTISELLVSGPETSVVVLELARRRGELRPTAYFRSLNESRDIDLAETGLLDSGLRRWVRNALTSPARRGFAYDALNEYWFDSLEAVADARENIETFLERTADRTDRRSSTVLVTSVIERIGNDVPAAT